MRFFNIILCLALLSINHWCLAAIEDTYLDDTQREQILPILKPLAVDEVESIDATVLGTIKNRKEILTAIKKLTITDFLSSELRLEGLKTNILTMPELNTAEYSSPNDFPSLKVSEYENRRVLPNWLIDALQTQARSLSLKPTTKTLPALVQEWKNDDWIYAKERSEGSPTFDDLSSSPKAWAGPVVNDGVVRYQKQNEKTIARIYFSRSEYFSDMQQVAQSTWAFATHHNIQINVSLEASSTDADYGMRTFPLNFNLNLPIQIVTPNGLVSAHLIKIHSGAGECNAGSWIEIALPNDKPLAMWAFLVLPDQQLATIATVKRSETNLKKDPNQDYMVGVRKNLEVVWQQNYLPALSITATRYDYQESGYDDKGNLVSTEILGSTWGSKVSSAKNIISNGNFDSCVTH